MRRSRDLALIALAGLVSILVVVSVVVLAVHDKVEPTAALGALAGVGTLGGVALGRLGPPAVASGLPEDQGDE